MIQRKAQDSYELHVDGVSVKFSKAPKGIKVSTHVFHTLLESYENSWGTMVALRTARTSAAKETSLLTSKRRAFPFPQCSSGYLKRVGTREIAAMFWPARMCTLLSHYTNHFACRFQVTVPSTDCWLPSLVNISSQGSYNVPLTLAGLAQTLHPFALLQRPLFGERQRCLNLYTA